VKLCTKNEKNYFAANRPRTTPRRNNTRVCVCLCEWTYMYWQAAPTTETAKATTAIAKKLYFPAAAAKKYASAGHWQDIEQQLWVLQSQQQQRQRQRPRQRQRQQQRRKQQQQTHTKRGAPFEFLQIKSLAETASPTGIKINTKNRIYTYTYTRILGGAHTHTQLSHFELELVRISNTWRGRQQQQRR